MKPPRDILLGRHQAAGPKLDAIRESIVTSVCGRRVHLPPAMDQRCRWRELIYSLRWHLAGLGTAWLVIILLNLDVGHSVSLASAIPPGKIPSAQIILASLRENRRELLQLIQPAELREARPPQTFPRSKRQDETLIA
jgi:hypothetical protein